LSFYLIGEAPNPATVGRSRLWLVPDSTGIPHSANRLRDFAGLTTREFLRLFPWRTNLWLVPGPPFPAAVARARGRDLLRQAEAYGALGVVVLGAHAAAVFGLDIVEPLAWSRTLISSARDGAEVGPSPRVRAAHVPHPSGRNPWWNEDLHRVRARAFFAALVDEQDEHPTRAPEPGSPSSPLLPGPLAGPQGSGAPFLP